MTPKKPTEASNLNEQDEVLPIEEPLTYEIFNTPNLMNYLLTTLENDE